MKKKKIEQIETTEEVLEEAAPPASKAKKTINTIINVILVIAIIIAAFCTYTSYVNTSGNGVPNIFGIRILSIQTDSMYPTLVPGDMIFDTAVEDTSELKIGDVITYWTVINGERVLNTHRIAQIYDGGNYLIFETKGDNNTTADALTVHESEIVGQWKGARIGGLGKAFDYLQTSQGFLIAVVIPVAIFFIFHLIQFFRVLFEYNNLKNKLLYEQERGRNEDVLEDEKRRMDDLRRRERERMENELREKLRAELLAAGTTTEPPAQETPELTPEEIAAQERAALEAEIRARVRAEMEAEAKAAAQNAQQTAKEEPHEDSAAAEALAENTEPEATTEDTEPTEAETPADPSEEKEQTKQEDPA